MGRRPELLGNEGKDCKNATDAAWLELMGEPSAKQVEEVPRDDGDPVRLPAEIRACQEQLRAARQNGGNVRKVFDDLCALAFSKPEWAGPASDFIADEFEGDAETLASMARVPDMIIELSEGHAAMTFMVASHWATKGETEHLSRLAEAMVAAHSRIVGVEAVELMLAVCTSIAVVKHAKAEQLLAATRQALKDEHHESLRDAEMWLAIGRIVRTATVEERRLWDERLRRPRVEWTWRKPLERRALEHLVDHLGVGVEGSQAYRAVVPPAWWDLLMRRSRERMESPELVPMAPPMERTEVATETPRTSIRAVEVRHRVLAPFIAGAILGVLGGLFGSWMGAGTLKEPTAVAGVSGDMEAIPSWRESRIREYERELGDLALEWEKVQQGTWEDNSELLMGFTSQLPADGSRYRKFLEWLMLDPPRDSQTREMVTHLLIHRFPDDHLLDLWEGIVLDEAPHSGELKEAARDALVSQDEGKGAWSERDVLRLRKLAGG